MSGFGGTMAAATMAGLALATAVQAQELRPLVGASRNAYGIASDCLLGATGPEGSFAAAADVAPQITASTPIDWYSLDGGQGSGTSHIPEWIGAPGESSYETHADGVPEAVGGYVGLAADWPVLPDVLRAEGTGSETYRAAIADYFDSIGHVTDQITVEQVIRTDLEGDGREEVVLTVTDPELPSDWGIPTMAPAGAHSVILLLREVDGAVQTSLVDGDIHDDAAGFAHPPLIFTVVAVADLNGDGVAEIVGSAGYYEGWSISVYRADGPEPDQVLSCGWGA